MLGRFSVGRGLLCWRGGLVVVLGLSTQFVALAAADDNSYWQQNHGNGKWHGGNGYRDQGNWNYRWYGSYGPRFYGQHYQGPGYYAPPPPSYYAPAPFYAPSFSFGLNILIH